MILRSLLVSLVDLRNYLVVQLHYLSSQHGRVTLSAECRALPEPFRPLLVANWAIKFEAIQMHTQMAIKTAEKYIDFTNFNLVNIANGYRTSARARFHFICFWGLI